MQPHLEEALRSLRVAARDIKAFQVLKDAPEIDLTSMCFHAQQAIEKSLKAFLFLRQVEFRRTHDLVELAQLLHQHGVGVPVADDQLSRLSPFAVALRYDDMSVSTISREAAAEPVILMYRWAEALVQAAAGMPDVPHND